MDLRVLVPVAHGAAVVIPKRPDHAGVGIEPSLIWLIFVVIWPLIKD